MAGASARREWLKPLTDELFKYDRKIARILAKAADDIDQDISDLIGKKGMGARVREAQLREIRALITSRLQEIYGANFELIKTHRAKVAELAAAIALKRDTKIFNEMNLTEKEKSDVVAFTVAQASRSIEAVTARQSKSKKLIKTIDHSNKYAESLVERRINSGLAKGASAADIAKDIKGLLDPNTPGGVSYAAKRIGRTEIANAFHAQAKEDSIGKPWIESVSWNLSKSHPSGSGCMCEKYAMKAKFKPEQVPDKPHPQCLCYITPNVKPWNKVLADIEDSRYDRWLEEHR